MLLALLAAVCALAPSAFADIPPVPAKFDLFHDLAGIVDDAEEQSIRTLQQQLLEQARVPVVVVTVRSMREYDPQSPSIESFARRWFDTWGIGSQGKNDGVLIIVSSGDRKARIELGADWGGRFDPFCRRMMDDEMVPRFKEGRYGAGLLAAVQSLAEIARAGPNSEPPDPGLATRILENPTLKFAHENNPIANGGVRWILPLMLVTGVGFLIAAVFFPSYRKGLIIAGLALIGLALFFWIVVVVFVLFNMATGRVRGSYRGGGGFSFGGGGGGFGGGSSGGGGASGSW